MDQQQSHLVIPMEGITEDESIVFLNELACYLEKFNTYQLESKVLTKEVIKIADIVNRMRKILELREKVLELSIIDDEVLYKKIENSIKEDYGCNENDLETIILNKWYNLI